MTDKRRSVDLRRSCHIVLGSTSAQVLQLAPMPCVRRNRLTLLIQFILLLIETCSFKYTHTLILLFSHMSSLQIFASYHSKRLIPPVRIRSNLVWQCPRSSRQKKADSLWTGNRSRLTSVVHLVRSSFLICNWQVVRFHKSLYSLPVIQCYTKGNFRIDLALLFPAIGLVLGISLHTV